MEHEILQILAAFHEALQAGEITALVQTQSKSAKSGSRQIPKCRSLQADIQNIQFFEVTETAELHEVLVRQLGVTIQALGLRFASLDVTAEKQLFQWQPFQGFSQGYQSPIPRIIVLNQETKVTLPGWDEEAQGQSQDTQQAYRSEQ